MIGTPKYLEPYARDVKIRKETVTFSIHCPCGCETFQLQKNSYTDEDKKAIEESEKNMPNTGWHSIYGRRYADGTSVTYIRKFFFFKKIIEFPPVPVCETVKVVKATCTTCQREIILFDSREHGYDSEFTTSEQREYTPYFAKRKSQPCNVSVRVNQLEEEDTDTNQFGSIEIFARRDGKKRCFFDAETA